MNGGPSFGMVNIGCSHVSSNFLSIS